MKTSSIRIEGNIISAELYEKLDTNEIRGQNYSDFGYDRSTKVKDEIARAWADAKAQWSIFKSRTEKLTDKESGVEETRKYWILPLLDYLGYKPEYQRSGEIVNNNSYTLSHRDNSISSFPIHIMGINDNLDRKRESGGPRMSPHALLQEYLNVTDHLYGIVTNGIFLRILRDSGKLVRLSYLEFNLQRMLEDDLYAEFSIMFRLIHSSRMPKNPAEAELSILEQYHQDAIESGSRIREKLSKAVEISIKSIANGFLKHPANEELRNQIKEGKIKPGQYFQYLLRFVYRILFLLVIEERDIVFPELKKDVTQEEKDKHYYFKEIYYKNYSVSRLRKHADKLYFFDDKLGDLWISLRNTFLIFIEERYAKKLGLYPLGGDLFSSDSIGILSDSHLDNKTLLECIRNLSLFESGDGKVYIRVNYASLNVEEFGSVYEGLLEYEGFFNINGNISFEFVQSKERSSSGSHYTPEELVQPLIKHSLDYVIEERLKSGDQKEKESALLSIKTCDVACGSGHILLSAARRIAIELTRVRTGEDQPSPEPYRHALRDVINHCIYGVDKNPLAVELCKVALWLEAYNPGMPLSFLDNKIKCGDSIVGLARREYLERGIANESFKKMPGDDPEIVKTFLKKNKDEIKGIIDLFDSKEITNEINKISTGFKEIENLPEFTLEEVRKKAAEYNILKGTHWWHLKECADLQTAQFFIPKTKRYEKLLTTYSCYFNVLKGEKSGHERQAAEAVAVSTERRFFHWFLEFPEVFDEGGFDCILGNPPFLGGQGLSGTFGDAFLNYVKKEYSPAGSCDLVTYFFRRIFKLLKQGGFQSLISTNTIAQGTAREGGLDVILSKAGEIIFAVRSMRWPGIAAVEVSLIAIHKGKWNKERTLGNLKVDFISAYLDDTESIGNPFPLKLNEGKSFQGSIVLGKGFILEPEEARILIEKDSKNKEVLFPYLNGEDLNTNPDQSPSRWVINFFDWDENSCRENYPDCFRIIEERVKPERARWEKDNFGNEIIGKFALRKPLPEKWWIYAEKRPSLYNTISQMERVLVVPLTTKILSFIYSETDVVFSHACGVIAIDSSYIFSLVQSNMHYYWAWQYCSTMGGTTLRYTPSSAFQTFPFPQEISDELNNELESIGEKYHEFRRQLMLNLMLGLTKTYNLFHTKELNIENPNLKKAELRIPIEQAIKNIETLRLLHKEMDEAVLKAYGWTDIKLEHDFYEVDYLPENDRIRYTISLDARKEILKRLLALNHKIHAEEVSAGLWEKKNKKDKVIAPQPIDHSQEKFFKEEK